MKYVFDLDGTLCTTDDSHEYQLAEPYVDRIAEVNKLFDAGHHITIFTARGSNSRIDWSDLTVYQLTKWGIKHNVLIDKGKPSWDVFVDDKAISANEWVKSFKQKKIGFVASAFDLLHAGHCLMLKDAKKQCDWLIAALQNDPSIDRSWKNSPILSVQERFILLESNRYVDQILLYSTESDLYQILKRIKPDIRILGDDYINFPEKITGKEFCKEIFFHKRGQWSTTELRERIKKT